MMEDFLKYWLEYTSVVEAKNADLQKRSEKQWAKEKQRREQADKEAGNKPWYDRLFDNSDPYGHYSIYESPEKLTFENFLIYLSEHYEIQRGTIQKRKEGKRKSARL